MYARILLVMMGLDACEILFTSSSARKKYRLASRAKLSTSVQSSKTDVSSASIQMGCPKFGLKTLCYTGAYV